MTETLNAQLDAMQDNGSLEVFEPKVSTQSDFYSIVQEVIDEEETKNKGKKVRVRNVSESDMKGLNPLAVLLVLALFSLFIFILWFILF